MSSKARLADLLERVLDRLDSLDAKMTKCVEVAVDARTEVDTQRVRLLDEANRAGIRHNQLVRRVEALEHDRAAE